MTWNDLLTFAEPISVGSFAHDVERFGTCLSAGRLISAADAAKLSLANQPGFRRPAALYQGTAQVVFLARRAGQRWE